MQKEKAQPNSQNLPETNPSDDESLHMESLTLNQRNSSFAQTNDEGTQKKHFMLFESDFFKKKTIDKRFNKNQKHHEKKIQNYQRKVELLQRKVSQLQKEVQSLRRKENFCPNCRFNLNEEYYDQSIREIIIPQDYHTPDGAGTCERSNSKQSLEFEKINFMAPLMMSSQMEEKSWIFLGSMMIAMGSKIMDVDGTLNVFKVLKESVDSIRRQVEKCEQKIQMDFFMSKQQLAGGEYRDDGLGFDPFFTKHDERAAGFQLEGVKLEAVQQYELLYDQKLSFSVEYEALITVMQYLRQRCKII